MLPSTQTVTTLKNQLYYGDNLEVLQRYIKDETVDLVYLDPPFNSRQDYNVLFAEKDGSQSSSQIHAFEDTWEWNIDASAPTSTSSSAADASPTPFAPSKHFCSTQT